MTITTLLFDLDDTLIWEEPAAEQAMWQAAQPAVETHGIDAELFIQTLRSECRKIWYATDMHPYCKQIAISSWEGLWSPFGGPNDVMRRLREWAPTYRYESWRAALQAHEIADDTLARSMAEQFPRERRGISVYFPNAQRILNQLHDQYHYALVSNGSSDLQRIKIRNAGIDKWFDTILISGDIETRKPDAAFFHSALQRVAATVDQAVMIGNSLGSDIAGAQAVGMRSIWFNPDGKDPGEHAPNATIHDLAEIPKILDQWNGASS